MSRPLKILHVTTTTDRGGAEVQLLEFITHSSPDQMVHHVVCLRPLGVLAARMEQAGATVESLNLSSNPAMLLKGLWGLRRIIKLFQPTVINSWLYHANLLALLAKPFPPPPLLWGVHNSGIDPNYLKYNTRLLMSACAKLSSWPKGIVTNSEKGRTYHVNAGYPLAGFEVILNGFDTDRFRPDLQERTRLRNKLGLTPERVLLGMVSRFDPVKNHAGFLRAAARAVALRPELAFVALGTDVTPQNPALSLALQSPLKDHCFLLGESDEIPNWLTAMDAHVLNSFSEGLSNAVGEAMAAGLPQISTAVGDNTIMIGDCGIIIPPADEDALVKAMLEIVDMGAAGREQLGQKARQRIKDHFSPASNVQNYYKIYKQLIANSGH